MSQENTRINDLTCSSKESTKGHKKVQVKVSESANVVTVRALSNLKTRAAQRTCHVASVPFFSKSKVQPKMHTLVKQSPHAGKPEKHRNKIKSVDTTTAAFKSNVCRVNKRLTLLVNTECNWKQSHQRQFKGVTCQADYFVLLSPACDAVCNSRVGHDNA